MEINFKENSLIQLASSVNNKELSAVMLVQKSLDVIEELNPAINAFCAVNPESSMVQAEKVDALIVEIGKKQTELTTCIKELGERQVIIIDLQ